jgi:mRNA interferase MazF
VVVLSRPEVIGLLHTVMVAPVTSSIRGAPSEVVLGAAEGLKHPSAVNLDHVQTVEKARLTSFVGSLAPEKMRGVARRWPSPPRATAELPAAASSSRVGFGTSSKDGYAVRSSQRWPGPVAAACGCAGRAPRCP